MPCRQATCRLPAHSTAELVSPAAPRSCIPTSHGCVSETLKDAEYFWNFATIGTRVTIHGVSPTR